MKTNKTYEDWLKEYYPETASEAATKSRENNDSGLYAAKHSIKKWEGARKKVLDKHDMYADGTELCSNARNAAIIDFWSGNCSLCQYTVRGDCFYCPGTTANGCNCHDAYESMIATDSPRKMLIWLRKTVKYLETQNKQSKEI